MTEKDVQDAIADAVAKVMPTREETLEAITEGVRKAFDQVYASDILNAIADGTKEALRERNG